MATSTWVLDLSSNPPNIYNSAGTENVHNAFEPPYPYIYWYVNSIPDVTNVAYQEPQYMGAFMNAQYLTSVLIPQSVKYIGEFAFRNTQLTSVTIADDCVFFDTSFPDGCVINYY